MAYTYDPIFAKDPANPNVIAARASITIFDPADASKAPVAITDPTGVPLPNPITVDAQGMGPAFRHATLARVGWFGGGFTNYFTSYEDLKNEAVAARTAAQNAGASAAAEAAAGVATVVASATTAASSAAASATAAANAAALVGAPADAAIAAAVTGSGTATKAALSATYATKEDLTALPAGSETTRLAPLARITKASTGAFRILVGGTSIAEAAVSSTRMIIEQLKDAYGDTGIYQVRAGFLGGSTTNAAISGWAKQPFGGALFTRLRGSSTSTQLDLGMGYGNEVVIFWSQEADTGVSDVLVDGVVVGQIGTSGAQEYRKSTTFSVAAGAHTIKINRPASGYTYLEDIEVRSTTRTGVEAVYAALGGSMLRDARLLKGATGSQVAGIPVSGMAGVDSISSRASVDVGVYQWVVNDAGFNQSDNFTDHYKPAIGRVVANHAALGTPMVVIIEMGGHYAMPNDGGSSANHARFNTIRNYLLSLRQHPHVTVIDWHGATVDTDLARYAARYYPAVTNLNVAAGTYTGDFIHPNDNAHAVLHALLAETFGLTPPKAVQPSTVASNRVKTLSYGVGTDKAATVEGAVKRFAVPSGAAYAALATGPSSAYQGRVVPYYRDAAAASARVTTQLSEIAASATSTEYGKYLDWSLKTVGMGTYLTTTDRAYLTIKASGSFVIRADSPITLYTPEGQALPADGSGRTYLNYTVSGTQPIVFTALIGASANNGNLYVSGRVYDIGLAKSDVPVLPA